MKMQKNDKKIANVFYWLGYIMSDVEQIDQYDPLKVNIERLKDALFELVLEDDK